MDSSWLGIAASGAAGYRGYRSGGSSFSLFAVLFAVACFVGELVFPGIEYNHSSLWFWAYCYFVVVLPLFWWSLWRFVDELSFSALMVGWGLIAAVTILPFPGGMFWKGTGIF